MLRSSRTYLAERNWLPLSECTTVPRGELKPIAFRMAATAKDAFMRESIE